MSKSLKKLIDINRLREFKSKLVGAGSAYVQTAAVDQTIAGTKTFSKSIVGSVTGSSGSCTGNAASATKATQDSAGQQINTTYIKDLAVSGRTITYTKGDGSTGTITTGASLLPIGSYIQFAGSQAPDGFLVCNGGAISRTTYSNLFAVIGTTYGSGDGSTTFNLPNLTDRFLQGSTTSGTVKNAGLPNIYGYFGGRFVNAPDGGNVITARYGAFTKGGFTGQYLGISSSEPVRNDEATDFNASRSSSIYGGSTTVQPPALTCLICIKY